jgi:NodT family efflux transporter outer membrane factor (OMF) lipoprotein
MRLLSVVERAHAAFRASAKHIAICVGSLALCGCNLDWEKPELEAPPPPRFREPQARRAKPIEDARSFMARFGSPELGGLVAQALGSNFDLAAAAARIKQADATARINSAALWPLLSTNFSASRTQIPGTALSPTVPAGQTDFMAADLNFFSLGLSASYEIDFWGKNEDASKAARLLANATRFDRDVVEIAVIASVLNTYFLICDALDRLEIAHKNVESAGKALAAIKVRLDSGAATMFDYAQQHTVYNLQQGAIPPLEESLRQSKNLLAVLLGRTPESVDVKGGALTRLHFPIIAAGLPSEVLLRRPDVAEAEARLASQEFSVLQARAAFFPSIVLTGQYGVQSLVFKNLARPEAIAYAVFANAAQPLFDGYNLQGQYNLHQAKFAELAALYHKHILSALSDTENALIAVNERTRHVKIQAEAVDWARRSYESALARLEEGTIDTVSLTTVEMTYFQAQDQLAQLRLSQYQTAALLFQALGGGWAPTTREIEIAKADEAYLTDKGPWP